MYKAPPESTTILTIAPTLTISGHKILDLKTELDDKAYHILSSLHNTVSIHLQNTTEVNIFRIPKPTEPKHELLSNLRLPSQSRLVRET